VRFFGLILYGCGFAAAGVKRAFIPMPFTVSESKPTNNSITTVNSKLLLGAFHSVCCGVH
jgi:hypothetical protein